MNENEIILLVVGVLVIAMIAIFLIINSLRRAKLNKDLELAKNLNCNQSDFETLKKQNFESKYIKKEGAFAISFGFFVQILFSIALLAGFTFWTIYLFKQGAMEWAAYTGVLALIGLIMPFFVLGAITHRRQTINHINQELGSYEKTLQEQTLAPEIAEPKLKAESTPVPESKPEPESEPAPTVLAETKPYTAGIDENIPEDSMLRRHYLTQRRAEREDLEQREQLVHADVEITAFKAEEDAEFGKIPEDSMLRRHYLTHQRALKEEQAQTGQLTHRAEQPTIKATPKQEIKETIPEDSTLRRHFIANLIAGIESKLPPRPTDSMLRRHFDSMVEAKKEQRLAAMNH